MFFGSDNGGERAAARIYILLGACKLHGLQPDSRLQQGH
jgi:hypothetical protein